MAVAVIAIAAYLYLGTAIGTNVASGLTAEKTPGITPEKTPGGSPNARSSYGYVDIHVHTAGIGAKGSGAFVSQTMRDSYKFNLYLRAFGVTLDELETQGDRIIVDRIAAQVAASNHVSHAVILALDGFVNAEGTLDRERTQLHVPNEFVARETARHPNLLFGASINPGRPDAIARLEQAKADGAVLVKWIPSIMGFDPANVAFQPFYERMRDLKIALLTHGGQERAFGEADDSLGDPRRLKLALDTGVTVIVAHLSSGGLNDGVENYHHLLSMFSQYDNLYADISALTQINRRGYLANALDAGSLHPKMVYGSDWPLQFFPLVSPWYQWPRTNANALREVNAIENVWDRDVALKKAMGVPTSVFLRTRAVLGLDRR